MSSIPKFDPSRLTKRSAAAQYSSDSDDQADDDFAAPNADPSTDDFGDLNPRKRRRVGETKERAALGIFGSDSEDDGPGRNWKKKTLRSKGMSFVSGDNQGGQEEKEYSDDSDAAGKRYDEDEDEDVDYEEDENEEDRAGVGLGFRAPSKGLGFTATRSDGNQDHGTNDSTKPIRPSFPKTKFDGSNPLGLGFVPSSAKQPVLRETEEEAEHASDPPQKARPSAFTPTKGAKGKPNPKSFGARMMAKMGYVDGTGLGREGQGRNVIIEAHLRPQGVGLGAVREKSETERKEEKRQARMRGEVVVDSDEEEKQKKRQRKRQQLGTAAGSAAGSATGSGASTPRRPKTTYMTAEELKKTAPGLQIPEAFAPILDMTGPSNKFLTSASGLLTPTSGAVSGAASESAETAEARKIIRRAHADLAAFSEEWRNLEERKSWVALELKEREQEMADLASDLGRLQLFADMVTKEIPSAKEWTDITRNLHKAVEHVGSSNGEVADIAVAAIYPFLRDPDWDLLDEPARFAAELRDLQGLFGDSGGSKKTVDKWALTNNLGNTDVYRQHHKTTTAYETMMYKIWYPKAMTAIREWDVYNPTPLLSVLNTWNDLLPPFVRAQFLDAVVRKLESAVSEWNPRKKRQGHNLPHLWLFPWLQYLPAYHLDSKGTGLVADVRRKFRQLIDVWEFDRGVIPGLPQWRDVLSPQWQPLIMSHVLPSMGRYLRQNFRVDPADQEPYLPMLTGVLGWIDVLGAKVLGRVVVGEVFPRWHDKLREWLTLEEMNLEEVYAWYEWWRDQVFPQEISGLASVKKEFEKGAVTIQTALDAM